MKTLSEQGRFLISTWSDYLHLMDAADDLVNLLELEVDGPEDIERNMLANVRADSPQVQALIENWDAFATMMEIERNEVLPWVEHVLGAAHDKLEHQLPSTEWSVLREEDWGRGEPGIEVYVKRDVAGDHDSLSIRFYPSPRVNEDDLASWHSERFSPDLVLKGSPGVGASLHSGLSSLAPAAYGKLVNRLKAIELPEGATFFATTQDETPLLEVPLTPLTLDEFMDGEVLCDRIVERMLQVVKVAVALLPLVNELAPADEE